ncbi:iron-containing alcohol dehydrogenase [Oscillospiraceae bacterium MB08-C2-2]|nr:iron-containing alcohol dehydrogenase [Oscillospiraceae bacterium MB08-C2-2]
MQNFEFQNATKLVFGRNAEEEAGACSKEFGTRVLLHYGGGSIKRSGLYDRVLASLKAEGLEVLELGGVAANPLLSKVEEGIALCKKEKIDFILAVGGGSVIDSAKGIAAGAMLDEPIWDYYIEGKPVSKALPIGVVLTIPAAGSESSNGSVITHDETQYKRYISYPVLKAKFALMNPELTFTLSPYQTACGCADIFAHLLERYFAPEDHVELTDRYIESTMKVVLGNLPVVLEQPENYDARAELMFAGTLAHNGLLNCGRTGDWGSHDIEHELSGLYNIAHGAGLSIIFPAWMKYMVKEAPEKFAQFARRVFGIDDAGSNEEIAHKGIAKLEDFFRSVGLPVRFSEADLPADQLELMAEKAVFNRGTVGNLKPLGKEDIVAIYKLAL